MTNTHDYKEYGVITACANCGELKSATSDGVPCEKLKKVTETLGETGF